MPELGIVSPSTVFRQITVPPGLAEVIATHKALFGGFVMEANDGGAEGNADGGDSARTFTQAALKAKAEAHDKAEEANKGELQKAIDRATAAEKKVADFEAADKKRQADAEHAEQVGKWTAAAAKKNGVPAEAIKGTTEQDINEHAKMLAGLLPRRASAPREGEQPEGGGTSEMQAFARQLFNRD